MATAAVTFTDTNQGYRKAQWAPMANGDVGAPVNVGRFPYQAYLIQGTFGSGGSIQWEASYDGGTTWVIVGSAATAAAAGQIASVAHELLRPHCTAGDGTTALVVYLNLLLPR